MTIDKRKIILKKNYIQRVTSHVFIIVTEMHRSEVDNAPIILQLERVDTIHFYDTSTP